MKARKALRFELAIQILKVQLDLHYEALEQLRAFDIIYKYCVNPCQAVSLCFLVKQKLYCVKYKPKLYVIAL